MSKPVVLVTGANGEIGRSLLQRLHTDGRYRVVTVDLTPLPERYRGLCLETYAGNILDRYLLDQIAAHHEIGVVFHLAALLSTRGERDPELAHQINVEGTLHLLRVAQAQSTAFLRSKRRRRSVASAKSSVTPPSRCTGATSSTASTSAGTSRTSS